MNLSKVWEIEKDKGAWHAAIHGISKSRTWVSDRRTTREHLPNLKPGVFQTGPDWIDVTCSKVALAAQCKMIWRRPKAKVRVIPLQTRLLAQSRIQVRNYTGLNKGMAVRFIQELSLLLSKTNLSSEQLDTISPTTYGHCSSKSSFFVYQLMLSIGWGPSVYKCSTVSPILKETSLHSTLLCLSQWLLNSYFWTDHVTKGNPV